MFDSKTLMITGGTGSFGHAVLKRFLNTDIKEIRIFSRDEKKQEDMRILHNHEKLKFYIGDVRDYGSVCDAMMGVDYVFHAAALKQVPSCEFYPMEAVKTNISGTENVINACIRHAVKKMVLLSTDKAVYPVNAMGMSKAMAEKIMIAKSRHMDESGPVLCATRYGNVMASRGSVIPLFIEQIKKQQNITVTDANMTRFLMTLCDSVELVMHAFEHANQGDIFVQKAPAATMQTLTQAMQEIFLSNCNVDIIGTRHGEKLFETLVSREELSKAASSERYFQIKADDRDLNYRKYFVEGEQAIAEMEDYTSHNTTRLSLDDVKSLLLRLDCIQEALDD